MEHEKQPHSAGAARQGGNTSDNGSQASSVLTDERIVEVIARIGSQSLNVTRMHEINGKTSTIMENEGVLEFARAIEAEVLAQAGVRAEPVAWMNPETLDVIHDARKRAWENDFGMGGKAKAAGYTHRLVTPAQVPAAEVRAQALEMARSYIEAMSAESGYGYARPANPHDFSPDPECCDADEIAAHNAACEAYDKGEYTPERGSEWVGAMHILRAPWGIGTYTMRDEQAVKVLAAIDSALAQSSTADKASEVRAVALTAEDVQWVTNDNAELGVKIGNQFFFLYKGGSLIYEQGKHDDGSAMYWRPVFRREFGECAHPINYENPYLIGTVSLSDSDEWKILPAALSTAGSGNTSALGEGAGT